MRKSFILLAFISVFLSINAYSKTSIPKNLASDTIDVLHYGIHLDIGHKFSGQLFGFTDVQLIPKINNLHTLTLELLFLTIDSVLVNNTNNVFSYLNNKIVIPLAMAVNIGDTLIVKVYYRGIPHVETYNWGGFHISSGLSYNLGISFTDDPHNYGKCFFPCVDDFIDRAFYDYYITVDSTKYAVCGGTLMNILNNTDGSKTFHWKFNNTIPAYLASVAVYNYVAVSGVYQGMNGNIPTAVYVLAADTNKAKATFIHLNSILQTFEHYWGPYRWERVGYVSTTEGAMEHATNIAFNSAYIDGSLNGESVLAHELSHHWFGDLITCKTAEDMWINEGWATFNEALYKEGVYGKKAYKDYLRTKLKRVLQFCHIEDNGYRALYGIPTNYTYGETVYQKGSCVVQSLRGYLGDSLFFGSVQQMLNQYAFDDISTSEMRDFMNIHTTVNLSDFFNFHVYHAGFTHYSIDSTTGLSGNSDHWVYVRQKLKAAPAFANSNVVEITFMNNNWNKYTDTIHFDGEFGKKLFQIPFVPSIAMMDMDEKIADATTDSYEIIKNTGIVDYPESFFQLDVQQIADSALVRAVHNWVKPDSLKTSHPEIVRISSARYWLIEGIFPTGFNAKGKFYYNCQTSVYLDHLTLLPSYMSTDSLILLYRRNTADDWHMVNFVKDEDQFSGYITTSNLQQGEYVLGIGNPFQSGLNKILPLPAKRMEIFPNPNEGKYTIKLNDIEEDVIATTFTSEGILLDSIPIAKNNPLTHCSYKTMKAGNYLIKLSSREGYIIATEQMVVVKK